MAHLTPTQRFAQYVKPMESGCHEWQSTIRRDGYGSFWFAKRQALAHRVAYVLLVGDPGELRVLHRCDNRRCVNPDHLFLGTDRDNVRDMVSKGRHWGRRKVTNEALSVIRARLSAGVSQQAIADEFGIQQTTVSRIKLGQRAYLKHNI
jgi:hypothetical protein